MSRLVSAFDAPIEDAKFNYPKERSDPLLDLMMATESSICNQETLLKLATSARIESEVSLRKTSLEERRAIKEGTYSTFSDAICEKVWKMENQVDSESATLKNDFDWRFDGNLSRPFDLSSENEGAPLRINYETKFFNSLWKSNSIRGRRKRFLHWSDPWYSIQLKPDPLEAIPFPV